jgi:hypothetical protein
MDEQLIDKRSSGLDESVVAIHGVQGGPEQNAESEPKPLEEARELLTLIFPVVS